MTELEKRNEIFDRMCKLNTEQTSTLLSLTFGAHEHDEKFINRMQEHLKFVERSAKK